VLNCTDWQLAFGVAVTRQCLAQAVQRVQSTRWRRENQVTLMPYERVPESVPQLPTMSMPGSCVALLLPSKLSSYSTPTANAFHAAM
jgi:hypothetical protein